MVESGEWYRKPLFSFYCLFNVQKYLPQTSIMCNHSFLLRFQTFYFYAIDKKTDTLIYMGDNLIHDSLVYLVLCNMRQCQRPAE